jgi:hypothetical protein
MSWPWIGTTFPQTKKHGGRAGGDDHRTQHLSMSQSAADILREELECPLCRSLFVEPITLPSCGHSFCRPCLQSSLQHSPLSACSLCRAPTLVDAAHAPRSITIDAIVRALYPSEAAARRRDLITDRKRDEQQQLGLFFLGPQPFFPGEPLYSSLDHYAFHSFSSHAIRQDS